MPTLKAFNTFGVDVSAQHLKVISNPSEIRSCTFTSVNEYLILGGGSNLLFRNDVDKTILKNEIKMINILSENEDKAVVEFGGGENWHDAVLWAIDNGLAGIENLSLIPGTMGASPIQNIGAYGVEIKDLIEQVHTWDLIERKERTFSNEECQFGYRDSFFKQAANKGRFFITSVVLVLSKNIHDVNVSYGAIAEVLQREKIIKPTIKNVSDAVIEIRRSKLPDPLEIGNSGSFFKNPIITQELFDRIKSEFTEIPSYPAQKGFVKVPAGWLIEQCGWKGKRVGNTGNYAKQALIIVNHGGATGDEIYTHAVNVKDSVKSKYGIELEFEVNII